MSLKTPPPRAHKRVAVAALAVGTIVTALVVTPLSASHRTGRTVPRAAAPTRPQPTAGSSAQRDCLGRTGRGSESFARLDACGYPSPNTTGVPRDTSLTPVSAIDCTGRTVDAVSTSGPVSIGSDCTITNSRIIGQIVVHDGATKVNLSHDEISGPYTGRPTSPTCAYDQRTGRGGVASAILWEGAASGLTLDHDYLHCAAEPFNGNGIVTNSYIISDECWGPCGSSTTTHNEAVYIAGGGVGGSVFEHNTILNPWPQTAGVFGDDHAYGPLHDLTISDNLVAAGGDNGAIATGRAGDGNTSVRITGNRLSYVFSKTMPAGGDTGAVWSGNYRDDTVAPVPVDS